MSIEKKEGRTQVNDLASSERELSDKDMEKVQGGTSNLNLSKSNTPLPAAPSTTVAGGIVSPTPPITGELGKAAPMKEPKEK